jgi:hypothetical protein
MDGMHIVSVVGSIDGMVRGDPSYVSGQQKVYHYWLLLVTWLHPYYKLKGKATIFVAS